MGNGTKASDSTSTIHRLRPLVGAPMIGTWALLLLAITPTRISFATAVPLLTIIPSKWQLEALSNFSGLHGPLATTAPFSITSQAATATARRSTRPLWNSLKSVKVASSMALPAQAPGLRINLSQITIPGPSLSPLRSRLAIMSYVMKSLRFNLLMLLTTRKTTRNVST